MKGSSDSVFLTDMAVVLVSSQDKHPATHHMDELRESDL